MALLSRLTILVLVLISASRSYGSISSSRPCVIENRIGKEKGLLAFSTSTTLGPAAAEASVQVSYGNVTVSSTAWGPWQNLKLPGSLSPPISNVVCGYTDTNQTQIFAQLSDGQVYTAKQDQADYLKFSTWTGVGENRLPADWSRGSLLDSVFVGPYKNYILLFARSKSRYNSKLFFCKGSSTGFGSWILLGGSKVLGTDATFIMNPFSGKYEAFMISPGGVIHRTWQHNENSFAAWRSMAHAPKFDSNTRPVASVMGYKNFNGKLLVAGLGKDGYVHRCEQATCDKLENPWGYCTWGNWHQTGGPMPFVSKTPNNVAVSRNVHFGVELFSVDDATGQLWQAWQLKRDAPWHDWTKLPGQNLSDVQFSTLPYFTVNGGGWWTAFAQSPSSQIVSVEPSRSMNATPNSVPWGSDLKISWSVAVDEASSGDWVAIYPVGATNDQYVDYRYVQGGLNPGGNPVPTGNVIMTPYLPNGTYQVRYLVDKMDISVVQQDVTYYNQSTDSQLKQLIRGIFEGLVVKNVNLDVCVNEGALTVQTFGQSLAAFKQGQIFKGLNLFGTALFDVLITLRICDAGFAAINQLRHFVDDLIACVRGNCVSFVIDVIRWIFILYKDRYEIYGDIKGATNSFHLKAYQQGGLCIGRLVKACLGLTAVTLNMTDYKLASDGQRRLGLTVVPGGFTPNMTDYKPAPAIGRRLGLTVVPREVTPNMTGYKPASKESVERVLVSAKRRLQRFP